jgi:hypothetical protein
MHICMRLTIAAIAAMSIAGSDIGAAATPHWTVLGWNDLGMHCMDSDYSAFSILPPFNNVRAQIIDANGHLATASSGVHLSYEAVADPDGSINRSSIGKTGFWNFMLPLFGTQLVPDQGLAGCNMPGPNNIAQPMSFDANYRWFGADGIPLTPYDDNGHKNPYPLMRLVVRDALGTQLAESSVVLPVSDEMDCSQCHNSNTVTSARPSAGWVNDPNGARDFRLNILRLHDDRQAGNPVYSSALAQLGINPAGLYASVHADGRPVLCASCHGSNALPGTGLAGIAPLTAAMHSRHASARDPITGMTLDSSANRAACYSCHPGSSTKCLRGAMGAAIAGDGSMAMQCQSCHGNMSKVGESQRQGWLQQPSCQNCHTGNAVQNAGLVRYTSAFSSPGVLRPAVNPVFATNSNQPAAGFDLYRFSTGHGGLYCEACHGSTHAEFPSAHRNDNLQSVQAQGHAGVISECTVCHASPRNGLGGPHGLHPLGAAWVNGHGDYAENNSSACKNCHGADYRGGVLSAAQADLTVSTRYGTKNFWRGFQIGCYACHNGPSSESASSNHAPTVANATIDTAFGSSANLTLSANDSDGNSLTLRVVSQPAHGSVALADRVATYIPEPGFSGDEEFTYAAWDGKSDSNLGRVQAHVRAPGYAIGADITGAWYDPAQNGQGWFIESIANGGVVASWYVYLNGEQRWLIGSGTATGDRVRMRMTIGSQGQFPPNYDLTTTQLGTWGEVELQFVDPAHATATWITPYPGFAGGQMPLTRLTTIAPADGLSPQGLLTQCHSGTWYNAGQSGHGLQIEVLSDNGSQRIVAVWYAFLNGSQRWLIAQGPVVGANAVLDAITTSGGQFPPNFNPANVLTQPWGSLQLRAIDADHLHLDWSSSISGFGSGGLDLERLTGVSGHICP